MKDTRLLSALVALVAILLATDVALRIGAATPAKGPEDRIADALQTIADNGIQIRSGSKLEIEGVFGSNQPIKVRSER